jgi:hypothetical protein
MYSTPVYIIEDSPGRWLVAPYGEVQWVLNARRAGHVTLTKGSVAETVDLLEMNPNESAPILRKYLARARIMQPYFDVHPDSSDEAFVAEAPRHPVFQLSVGTQTGT